MPDHGIFGKYRLLQPIAQGGMAEIFLAKHEGPAGFSKTVVIKRVLPHLSSSSDFVGMFLDEARLAARLSHPNIVHISDFGEADGVYFLCMEHLAGEDLSAMLRLAVKRGHPFPATIAASIVAAACDGLHYAHTLADDEGKPLRIVHRDISPSNLFVTYQGAVKILDFGIAKAEGKVVQTKSGTKKGKLQYMSPEQVSGKPLDARSDVFALGVVLYELLTGVRPFQREEEVATIMAIVHDPIVPPSRLQPDVPGELDDVVLRALERDLGKRFQSANGLRRALELFLSSRTTAPISSQLQEFMREQVGEERIRLRSAPVVTPRPGGQTPPLKPAGAPPAATRILPPSGIEEAPAPTLVVSETVVQPLGPVAPPEGASRGGRKVLLGAFALVLLAAGALAITRPWEEPGLPPPAARITPRPDAAPVPTNPGSVAAAAVPTPVKAPEPAALPARPDPVAARPPKPKGAPSKRLGPTPPGAKPAPEPGFLDVNCVPWCRVFVDDKDALDSPVQGMRLAAGVHRVRVVNPPSGMSREREVTVKANETAKELIRF